MPESDPSLDLVPSRYVVGIDLGTTNSAVCYVDTERSPWQVQNFAVPQLVGPGEIESHDTLPSFHFEPTTSEARVQSMCLPWQSKPHAYVVGTMARNDGMLVPGRLIASAKSWLCHAGVDRTADLLPWQGASDVERLSPIAVSSRYLRHIREAWNHAFSKFPLADQDIVLTLPASFDEVARELTVQAAAMAELPRVVLIEEPQAAFYAWVDVHRDNWESKVEQGQKILVCDIGGGTSDFTLIRVRAVEDHDGSGNAVQFHRIAVGDHLILGGDNLDLALAKHLEAQLSNSTQLDSRQWDVLVRNCRLTKEKLLGHKPPDDFRISLPGSGSKLIGGSLQVAIRRDEAEQVLIEGFFPQVTLDDRPRQARSGFQEFGLPFTPDSAITRYLAAFLTAHRHADEDSSDNESAADPGAPDLVLLNGGLFASPVIQDRVIRSIESWFRQADNDDWSPTVLENDRLDLAVARGAAYYGMVRRGEGVRIAAGLARTYYVAVADERSGGVPSAVCVVPGSALPGESIQLNGRQFNLRISEPVEFPLYVSSTRLTDLPGELVPIDTDHMRCLPSLRTALRTQRRNQRGTVPVQLHAHLSEIGTIELSLKQTDGDRSWRLQFDVRAATQTDQSIDETSGELEGVLDEAVWQNCEAVLRQTFDGSAQQDPGQLVKVLNVASGTHRNDWPMSLLRRMWECLMELEAGRRRSPLHEARWLNLLGYSLRPGYGMAVDDWRVTETWRTVQGKLVHKSPICRTESWILWRRIAGGMPARQQRALAEPLLAAVKSLHRRMTSPGVKGDVHFTVSEFAELWRLLGSLELLNLRTKTSLGDMLVELLDKRKFESVRPAIVWTLGRLGARIPVYGPLNTVVDAAAVDAWSQPLNAGKTNDPNQAFALMQMARRTGDRYRDVSESVREKIADGLRGHEAPEHLVHLVTDGGQLDVEEQRQAFGESLPKGLQIR